MPYDLDDVRGRVATAIGVGYTPDQIITHLSQDNGDLGSHIRMAVQAGYSPAQIIDHLNPAQQSPGDRLIGLPDGSLQDIPVLAPIQRGIASAQAGVANLADDVGLHDTAAGIRSRINQVAASAPSSGADMAAQLAAGHYGVALADIPSAALEQTLPAAAGIATGALTGGAAPVAAMAARLGGGAAIGALTSGDAIARARAANNGEATPSASDVALGLAGGAATGAAGSIGLGGVGEGLAGAAGRALAHAAGDAAQPELESLAGSVGTAAGPQNATPSDMAAAALTGLGSRVGMAAPDALKAAASFTPSARQAALAERYGAMTPDQQMQVQNVVAAHQAMQDATANAIGTADASPKAAARAASDAIHRGAARLVGKLASDGIVNADDAKTIGAAMTAARSPGSVLTQDDLDAIDGLGLNDDDAAALKNAAVQLQVLSDPQQMRATAGPFQTAAEMLGGHTGGAITGALLGGLHGAGVGYLVGGAVRPVVRNTLGTLGAALDGATGFGKSPLQQSADNNRAMLKAAGVQVPDAADDLQAAMVRTRDVIAQQRALMRGTLSPTLQAAADKAATVQALAGLTQKPAQAPDPIAAAQARADAQKALSSPGAGPAGIPTPQGASATQSVTTPQTTSTQGNTYAPDMAGMSAEALAQAARLPQWVYGLGASLENALHVSGIARPVNMSAETNDALNRLQAKGWLPTDIVDGLKSHQGRIVPLLYELLRNEMLLHHGINRTVGSTGTVAASPMAGVMAQAAE